MSLTAATHLYGTEPITRIIAQLTGFENHDRRVLSLFMTLDPTTAEGRNIAAQFHAAKQACRMFHKLPEVEHAQFTAEAERALALAKTVHGARSVAVHVCPQTGFAQAVPLPIHVAPCIHWDRRAWLGPLRDLANPRNWLLVLLADKVIGRLFIAGFDTIHALGTVSDDTSGKPDPGSQAQSNLARRHDEWLRRHARTIVHELGELARAVQVGGLAISAPPEMMAGLQHELPMLSPRLTIETMHVAADATESEILEQLKKLSQRRSESFEQALFETLVESIGRNRASLGIMEVASAIASHQVQVLICAENTELRGKTCSQCELILPMEHSGLCPVCGSMVNEQPYFVEYLADRVIRQKGSFERVEGVAARFLQPNGGVAALLRYPLGAAGDLREFDVAS
ncbi:MAG: hypothetical protein WEE89_09530 [Gemmatimonadota bacterium]